MPPEAVTSTFWSGRTFLLPPGVMLSDAGSAWGADDVEDADDELEASPAGEAPVEAS
ncbi:hypothetical protein GCM10028814_26080 [Angustibacter aerolatus]